MLVCAQLRVFINLAFELLELSRLFNPNLLKIDVADEFRALPFCRVTVDFDIYYPAARH